MNIFEQELLNYFGSEKLTKIQSTHIGIAGLGGLGSNCACALLRSGFRKFTLCDFDIVENKNLNRQFYFLDQAGLAKTQALKANLLRINPDAELTLVNKKIEKTNAKAIFSACDVIIEAFDQAVDKCMLAQEFTGSAKLYVSASGLAGWGDSDALLTRKIGERFYLIGDNISETSSSLPPCAPRVLIAAAKQADVVLAWVLKNS